MKCEVCGRQTNSNYSHLFYIDDDCKTYVPEYEDYSKSPHYLGTKSKDDVMVCRECYIHNSKEIHIPKYIPKKQFKKYLINYLKKRRII